MRILLTNDDGISSPGILLLAESLRNAGHRVYIAAPSKNRSGSSHSIIFLNEPIKLTETESDTWSCSGTPVDCVIVSLLGGIPDLCIAREDGSIALENAPELILSGINIGANLGTDIVYSGTAAAARQGSIFGIPSVALSLAPMSLDGNDSEWLWQPVVSYITENLDKIAGLWKAGIFVNINLPNSGKTPSALVKSFPAKRNYKDRIERFISPCGSTFCFAKVGNAETVDSGHGKEQPEPGSDWAEILKNNAAYSLVFVQPEVL